MLFILTGPIYLSIKWVKSIFDSENKKSDSYSWIISKILIVEKGFCLIHTMALQNLHRVALIWEESYSLINDIFEKNCLFH
jgi:hypothetical protein